MPLPSPLSPDSHIFLGAGGADDDFTYALFPIQEKVQHRVTLTYTRTLTGLSLCGWVEHKPVFVGEDSSFVTVGDKGQFRYSLPTELGSLFVRL